MKLEYNPITNTYTLDGKPVNVTITGTTGTGTATTGTATVNNNVTIQVTGLTPQQILLQSAFKLDNGMNIIIYTGMDGIVSYQCDENFKPYHEPFARCPREMMVDTPEEYHLRIRKMHGEDKLVKEHSSVIS
jgi:hypothetical protein